ncbi:MAG: MFS transporter, partial [Bdellovibrionales bacterium]|nr:MFS transporter [Bdellovibrionales bacterium]
GYRLAIWITRTAPLVIAEFFSWQLAYYSMAALMSLNLLASFWAEEPKVQFNEEKDLKKILFDPIKEFFQRDSISSACFILSFILFYKLGDAYASLLTSPFYIDIGFSKSEIAAVDGTVGFISQFVGLFLGGGLIVYLGINRSLWICGFLQMISTAGFSFLAYIGADTLIFSGVVAFENISSGMGTATFVAFMAALTDKRFTATQYALLTSLMSVPMNLIGASSGILAESVGWFWFFLICTVAAIPGLILLSKVAPLKSKN